MLIFKWWTNMYWGILTNHQDNQNWSLMIWFSTFLANSGNRNSVLWWLFGMTGARLGGGRWSVQAQGKCAGWWYGGRSLRLEWNAREARSIDRWERNGWRQPCTRTRANECRIFLCIHLREMWLWWSYQNLFNFDNPGLEWHWHAHACVWVVCNWSVWCACIELRMTRFCGLMAPWQLHGIFRAAATSPRPQVSICQPDKLRLFLRTIFFLIPHIPMNKNSTVPKKWDFPNKNETLLQKIFSNISHMEKYFVKQYMHKIYFLHTTKPHNRCASIFSKFMGKMSAI